MNNRNFYRFRRKYCGMVIGIDEVVGKITQALRRNKMLDNTIIFFSSDNGGVPFAGGFNYPFR